MLSSRKQGSLDQLKSRLLISSLQNTLVRPVLAQDIQEAIQACRQQTLDLACGLSAEILSTQAHPDFSPIGWHLGHIAYVESV